MSVEESRTTFIIGGIAGFVVGLIVGTVSESCVTNWSVNQERREICEQRKCDIGTPAWVDGRCSCIVGKAQ